MKTNCDKWSETWSLKAMNVSEKRANNVTFCSCRKEMVCPFPQAMTMRQDSERMKKKKIVTNLFLQINDHCAYSPRHHIIIIIKGKKKAKKVE